MKNRRENIKNELAYFYKVIKNMDIKDNIKQSKIKEYETSLDEVLYDNFSDNTDLDKQSSEKGLLGWIELIESPQLYKAIKSLTVEEQIFISHIFKECLSKEELATKYGINRSSAFDKTNKILRVLRRKLFQK